MVWKEELGQETLLQLITIAILFPKAGTQGCSEGNYSVRWEEEVR